MALFHRYPLTLKIDLIVSPLLLAASIRKVELACVIMPELLVQVSLSLIFSTYKVHVEGFTLY